MCYQQLNDNYVIFGKIKKNDRYWILCEEMAFVYNLKHHRIWHQNRFTDTEESKNKVGEGTLCPGFQWIMYLA